MKDALPLSYLFLHTAYCQLLTIFSFNLLPFTFNPEPYMPYAFNPQPATRNP